MPSKDVVDQLTRVPRVTENQLRRICDVLGLEYDNPDNNGLFLDELEGLCREYSTYSTLRAQNMRRKARNRVELDKTRIMGIETALGAIVKTTPNPITEIRRKLENSPLIRQPEP